ncbi:M1 family metallopeptidase [Garciella nitratireducens]|uniref:Peptidase family M1 n=1 Tax=Garciella nitratireducens DSM 15102 TaxID=1121911 RepID=A0A1T4PG13_9FIRM|nr:M1 family metallopeptidase [Garciella nitratireducens]SJZ90257.1 Peptidase family M1 [Garciella nitratireducens DSM 15102]
MKKKALKNIALILLVIILGIGVCEIYGQLNGYSQTSEGDLSQYGVHHYKINARFLEEKNLLQVQQEVFYENKYEKEFDTIYFHLYPNAFQEEKKAPFPEDEIEQAYPSGFEPGYIKIEKVKVEGKDIKSRIEGQDDTILALSLKQPLKPNEKITIEFEYQVKVPPCVSRFGYGENTYNFGNWYPIASVYDESGWNLEPYYAIGDPFYSEVGNYEVTLQLPKKYELATTGNIKKTDTVEGSKGEEEEKIWKIEAQGVRDFAWVISDDFQVKTADTDGTQIKVYYLEGQEGNKALEVAKNNIKIFNKLFGKYPYQQFSVVSNDFYIGGMEYPNLVYIDQNIFSGKYNIALEYIITHETAHQWWYGMIGNDEVDQPWLDEALTEYSTMLYYRERYGEKTMMTMFNEMIVNDYVRTKALVQGDERIAKSVKEFENNRAYSGIVYGKGAMMFYELEEKVGKENFQKILQHYFKENRFTNATEKDIQDATRSVTGKDYQEFFDQWLNGKIHLKGNQAA